MPAAKNIIVIPIYKDKLSSNETLSLNQAFSVLGKHDITAAIPNELDISAISSAFPELGFERFDDFWFRSLKSYNALVLNSSFYSRFQSYDYMLIYQLDAYVFRDELNLWAEKGYDYIGAPWIPTSSKYLGRSGRLRLLKKRMFHKCDGRKPHMSHMYKTGNGGFSLRKISRFIELTAHYEKKIDADLSASEILYPEDLWLLYEPRGKYKLSRPEWKEATGFAFEQNPGIAYRTNGNKLPFGCHAWYHPDYAGFWSRFIPSLQDK